MLLFGALWGLFFTPKARSMFLKFVCSWLLYWLRHYTLSRQPIMRLISWLRNLGSVLRFKDFPITSGSLDCNRLHLQSQLMSLPHTHHSFWKMTSSRSSTCLPSTFAEFTTTSMTAQSSFPISCSTTVWYSSFGKVHSPTPAPSSAPLLTATPKMSHSMSKFMHIGSHRRFIGFKSFYLKWFRFLLCRYLFFWVPNWPLLFPFLTRYKIVR